MLGMAVKETYQTLLYCCLIITIPEVHYNNSRNQTRSVWAADEVLSFIVLGLWT